MFTHSETGAVEKLKQSEERIMAFPIVPFLLGVATGAGIAYIFQDASAKERIKKVKESAGRLSEDVVAGAERVSEGVAAGAERVSEGLVAGAAKVSERVIEGAERLSEGVKAGVEKTKSVVKRDKAPEEASEALMADS